MAESARWPDPLADPGWQMAFGERAALEGVLSALGPSLSLEIGSGTGGSLRRIAAYSNRVHAIDVDLAAIRDLGLPNVELHQGRSEEELPTLLEELEGEGTPLDFALVDGDHSTDGVRADLAALLASPAARRTVVLLHDSAHPDVRRGIELACAEEAATGHALDLDFVPGFISAEPDRLGERWGGLALLLIGSDPGPVTNSSRVDLLTEVEKQRRWIAELKASPSWRLTAPLRAVKRRLGRRP